MKHLTLAASGLLMLSAAGSAQASNATFSLISTSGESFKIRHDQSNIVYHKTIPGAHQLINFYGGDDAKSHLVAEQVGKYFGLDNSEFALLGRWGDCTNMTFSLRHKYTGQVFERKINKACSKINFHGDDPAMSDWVAQAAAHYLGLTGKPVNTQWYLYDKEIVEGSQYSSKFVMQNWQKGYQQNVHIVNATASIDLHAGRREGMVAGQLLTGHMGYTIGEFINCDGNANAQTDLTAFIAGISTQNYNGHTYTLCLEPGQYNGFTIRDKHNLTITAPVGGVTISGHRPTTQDDVNKDRDSAIVNIWNSSNIRLHQLVVHNSNQFISQSKNKLPYDEVSRAVLAKHTSLTVSDSVISSEAKQTLFIERSDPFEFIASDAHCYYICINGDFSQMFVKDGYFNLNHKSDGSDTHSIFYTYHSNWSLYDLTGTMQTGASLITGSNSPTDNKISLFDKFLVNSYAANPIHLTQMSYTTYSGLQFHVHDKPASTYNGQARDVCEYFFENNIGISNNMAVFYFWEKPKRPENCGY